MMPGIDPVNLPDHLEAIRKEINALSDTERKALMGRIWGDTVRRNDARDQEAYERAERERSRKRPDSRQLALPSLQRLEKAS